MATLSFLGGQYRVTYNTEQPLPRGGMIDSDVPRESCPYCGQPECNYSCDESCGTVTGAQPAERHLYNGGLAAIDSLLLALVCSGVITENEDLRVNDAIQTVLDAMANVYGD